MQIRCASLLILGLVAGASPVVAQPPSPPPTAAIDHQGVACIIVAKYPKLKACFGSEVKEPRAYFRKQGTTPWFWVKMVTNLKEAPEPQCKIGVLPKPSRALLRQHIEYYLEDVGGGARTKEYDPLVVRQAQECKKDAPVAPISPTGPTAVFPAMPAGFTVGAFPAAAVGVATAAAAGTGVYFATKKNETTPTTTPTAPAPVPPAPVPPTTPPTTPPTATPPLDLSCQAEPKSGVVPLTVSFTAFPSGGTGSYDYAWQFGDGGTGVGRHPVHTFSSVGTFDVVLTVTSGDKVKQCERFITVNAPTPPPSCTDTVPPTTSITSPKDGAPVVLPSCNPTTISAIASDNVGVTLVKFFAQGTCDAAPVLVGSATTAPFSTPWKPLSCGTIPYKLTTEAFDACGNKGVSSPVNVDDGTDCGCGDPKACSSSSFRPVPFATCVAWIVQLDVPGATGQVVLDGQTVVAERGRRVEARVRPRDGDNVVEAQLVEANGKPGTWRFEVQGGEVLQPASLRVVRGEVVLVTPTVVLFRLKGQPGEQVSFTYRLRR